MVLDEHHTNRRDRFIYIHVTKHEDKIRTGDSHGCVRMQNADVAGLFMLCRQGYTRNNREINVRSSETQKMEKKRCARELPHLEQCSNLLGKEAR